ncbi:MAG: hypothetical protein M3311_02240 [Thermoproteota archaeon]|nr:hypothetical protein [Thermoproteota archaeon]
MLDTEEDCVAGEGFFAHIVSECEGFETVPSDAADCRAFLKIRKGNQPTEINCEFPQN